MNSTLIFSSCLAIGFNTFLSLHWYLAIICFPEHALKAPPPQLSVQPVRVTRSSDATATAKAEERRMSSESDILNIDQNSTIDVEAGSPTELGRMEIDTELADQSQRMAIDCTTPPAVLSDTVDLDARANDPGSESHILDMTNDDSEDRNPSQPTEDDKTYVLCSHCHITVLTSIFAFIVGKKLGY
jgi:hypothetical protein